MIEIRSKSGEVIKQIDGSDLSGCNLRGCNLRGADLRGCNLCGADLRGSNLCGSNLSGSDLCSADLSGAIGLISAADWLSANFKADELGILVYKVFGHLKTPPKHWIIEPSSVITEVVNPCRTTECGCGINFATLDWIMSEVPVYEKLGLWTCRIAWIDLADVVVPYNTDGKARCGRMTLLSKEIIP